MYAQYNLAISYHNGKGAVLDFPKALELFTKPDNQDLPDAQYSIASIYDSGEGVEQDRIKAIEWLETASQNGHLPAKVHYKVWLQIAKVSTSAFAPYTYMHHISLTKENIKLK